MTTMSPINWDVGIWVQALTLLNYSIKIDDIIKYFKHNKSTIYKWQRIARDHRFDPVVSSHVLV